jgi:predicted nuclease of restriction endonuclease-like RecB superfamily
MLPTNLLRIKISKGKINPIYVPINSDNMDLANHVIDTFKKGIGKKKRELQERLKLIEEGSADYRLIRGFSTLTERRCIFEVESSLTPSLARIEVFEESSKAKVSSLERRNKVIRKVAAKFQISEEDLEKALYSDIEGELILKNFNPINPEELLKKYNLALTQTLLFRSLKMEFSVSSNWKIIFRTIKRLGLMYSVEARDNSFKVLVDGSLSLIRMTERYGTAIAKLIPQIFSSESWKISADVLGKNKNRIYTFELESGINRDILASMEFEHHAELLYDSKIEERFARSFNLYNSGWLLKREPEPLVADTQVLIPDFSFEKHGVKVYMEIVGFWTQDYLERKVKKLNSLVNVDMIVAVDESLKSSRVRKLQYQIIYFRKNVPIKPILTYLKKYEESIVEGDTEVLKSMVIKLKGEVTSIEDIASECGISRQSIERSIHRINFKGYRKIGDYFISERKLLKLDKKLVKLKQLSEAFGVIDSYGIKNPSQVLENLGYEIKWNGLDIEKSMITKMKTQ